MAAGILGIGGSTAAWGLNGRRGTGLGLNRIQAEAELDSAIRRRRGVKTQSGGTRWRSTTGAVRAAIRTAMRCSSSRQRKAHPHDRTPVRAGANAEVT
jgi:hypothetical protein